MELELDGAPVSATCVHPGGVATNIVDASRVDTSIHALTVDEATHRRQANRLINATTADDAARQILAGSSAMRAACSSAPTHAGSTGSPACSAPATSG